MGLSMSLKRVAARSRPEPGDTPSSSELIGPPSLRYPDQAWEIEVPLRRPRFSSRGDVEALVADFHGVHKDLFAVNDPQSPIEMIGVERDHSLSGRLPARWAHSLKRRVGILADRQIYFHPTGWMRAPLFIVSRC